MHRTTIVISLLALILTACAVSPQNDQAVSAATATKAGTSIKTQTPAPTVALANKLTTGPTVPLPSVTPTRTAKPKPTATSTRTAARTHRTATPTTAPSPTPQVYVIEQFDTLYNVALEFDVPVDDLLEANNLETDDLLQVGQELVIPVVEREGDNAEEAGKDPAEAETDDEAASEVGERRTDRNRSTQKASAEAADAVAAQPPTPTPVAVPISEPVAAPSLGPNINPLTGLPVDDPAMLRRRPLMVRIGNDPTARTAQKGLNSADMVYEEITEWYVTRLTAIFLGEMPEVAGPIRSVRLVNVQLVPQYQGALAHSGGSDPVRWEVSQSAIAADLDEFFHPQPYFYHANEGWQTRLSVDLEAAREYLAQNDLDAPVTLPPFFFSKNPEGGEPGEDIYIPYPGSTFTEWHYDSDSGKYLRWVNGATMRDTFSGQIAASNVIVYFAEHRNTEIVEDSTGATSVRILVNGAGPAWFFRDGRLTKGSWQTDGTRPPYFTDEAGEPYSLKPGNTWVQLVPLSYTIGLNSADEASR